MDDFPEDILVRNIGADGNPQPGWVRVTDDRHLPIMGSVIASGVEALAAVPAGSARATEIRDWVTRANNNWPLPPGTYPLDGKRAIVIEEATTENRRKAQRRSRWASTLTRTRTATPTASRTPTTHAAALSKVNAARKALSEPLPRVPPPPTRRRI